MPLLVTGQFGLIGLALCFGLLLAPAVRAGLRGSAGAASGGDAAATVMATLVVLTVADALLNSFIFFPALLAAGGLAFARSAKAEAAQPRAAPIRAEFTPYRGPGSQAPRRPLADDRPVRSPGDPRNRS
jgi:hypothetical protein